MNAVTVKAPPSKSLSHRALIGAALAAGESVVENVLESRDLERTMSILAAAGAGMARTAPGTYTVRGVSGVLRGGAGEPLSCDVHESGTTCRLLTAILATGRGRFRIHGAPRMHERPVGELTAALEALGVHIAFEGRAGYPPFILDAAGIEGGEVGIGMDESSQYLSGLLLAAPLTRSGLTVRIGGRHAVSWPYVGLTLQTLEDYGVAFEVETLSAGGAWLPADWRNLRQVVPGAMRFRVAPGAYRAGRHTVEGDWSGAGYFLAAGAIGPRPVRVEGLRIGSLQGDRALLDILGRMGAVIESDGDSVTVSPAPLSGIDVDMGDCPDLVPTVAVVAAFASGRTTIRNVAHLRIKESDRIAAPVQELGKAGIRGEELPDGLTIQGGVPHAASGTVFSAHGDHRMAMSLALLGLGGVHVELDDVTCVGKSFPSFWTLWEKVLP